MAKVKEACAMVRSMIVEQTKAEKGHRSKIEGLLKKVK